MKESLQITSRAFGHKEAIPGKYYADRDNLNPPLEIREVPPETKSLVIYVEDPETDGNRIHWLVWNIDPNTAEIPEETSLTGSELPGAVQGKNDLGKIAHTSPAPDHWGYHQIIF